MSAKWRTCCLGLNVLMQVDMKNVPSGPIDNKPVQWNLYKVTTKFYGLSIPLFGVGM